MKKLKTLLVSNVMDPLTKDDNNLIDMYEELKDLGYYDAIETRLIQDNKTILKFNKIVKDAGWNVTFWITGTMGRKKLNLSSLNENLRMRSVAEAKKMIDLASRHNGHNIGIASGQVERYDEINSHILAFKKSVTELLNYLHDISSHYNIIIEPLDFMAHKKNVVGDLKNTLKFIDVLEESKNEKIKRVSLCWDSAHMALNKDDFENSIDKLAPYISRIHFSDAILDPKNKEYGDNHRHFDNKGFMNINCAIKIIRYAEKHSTNHNMYYAVEAKTKNGENTWSFEEKYRMFLQEALFGSEIK